MRDPDTGAVHLHLGEFFLLWTALDLGELPVVLEVPHAGRTDSARAELIAEADGTLAARGLGTVADPARDLAGLLRTLDTSEVTVELEHAPLRRFAVAGPLGAAVATVEGTVVHLAPVRATALTDTVLAALPDTGAGPGGPANVHAEDYERAVEALEHEGVDGFTDALHRAGVRAAEVNTLVRAVCHRTGGGSIAASVRTRGGRRARTPAPVHWADTPEGRYALRRNGGWLTVTPADPARLRTMAAEMVADLTG
ncbi:ESX secretion-associated protein EspG [Amycolatopsis antarctica]|uniref:ESX secretion-associated protein EspG n=1 Tax=Amycolatopsis antarctica TaxID=1854586 RepID=UPI0013FD8E9A|nr:ESX secretion-associated protein EspG [Amycolatopsis antarctica]